MKEKIIKSILFIIIFFVILFFVIKVLWIAPSTISYFYKEPKNSLDVVYVGSSNAYRHFNPVLAYNLYGYTTGLLSENAQPAVLLEYLIKEAEKYQKPSLYVIDIAKIANDTEFFTGEQIRNTTDSMKFSKNRIDAINEVLKYKKSINQKDYMSYYFSFFMYHNRWKRPALSTIIGNRYLYKGYPLDQDSIVSTPNDTYSWVDDEIQLEEESEEVLNSLIDYIKSKNLNVLFVIPRKVYDYEINAKLNTATKIIENEGMKVHNLNKVEELNIDFSTDLYDKGHLNVYGATKNTLYFARYLKENYELKNHKNDDKYKSWDKEYERFKDSFKKLTNKDFDELLSSYSN